MLFKLIEFCYFGYRTTGGIRNHQILVV